MNEPDIFLASRPGYRWFWGVIMLLLACGAGVARADEGGSRRAERRLTEGRALFDDLEYKRAIRKLEAVVKDRDASSKQRVRALEVIGLSHFILEDLGAAQESFAALLAIDPGHELTDDFDSDKIRAFFLWVKHEYLSEHGPAALEHDPPKNAVAGRKLAVDAQVARGADMVKELWVFSRRQGTRDYESMQMLPRGDDRFRARLPVAPSRQPYQIEYYIEGRDLGGRPIAWHGTADAPLDLPVAAGPRARAWYKRWYVIAGGVALIGVATALVIAGR